METKKEAAQLFNETWDLLDLTQRTDEDKALMLQKAHASRHLWGLVGEPVNAARGDWQIARVYSVLGMKEPALLFANRSLNVCLKNSIGGLDLAFGYEAVARAYSLSGDRENTTRFKGLALAACEKVESPEDRKYATGEVENIPDVV
jgi:hypothetical protein